MSSLFSRQPQNPATSADHEAVRVSLAGLIRLNQVAAGLTLRHAGIRAAQGGNYISSFKGRGMEFDETRPYTPGDDIRNLDWRVTARTGKTHTKLFREERERPVFLAVDARAPMFFATRGVFKSVMAARLAAIVAWSAQRHGDRVGGQIFSEDHSRELRPEHGRRAVLRLLQKLVDVEPPASLYEPTEIGFENALARLVHHARPGSLVFIFSDFRRLTAAGESSLLRLRKHCDVTLVFIHDPLERQLPSSGRYRFGDGVRELSLDASPAASTVYANRFAQRLAAMENLARQHAMRFIACRTTDDPLLVLQQNIRGAHRPAGSVMAPTPLRPGL
jgi:uncharacterized protein (DUF58 family)